MYHFLKFIIRVFYSIIYKIEITGEENIPQNEGIIIAPNHIHFVDPLIIGSFYKGHPYAMAKKELFKNPILSRIIRHLGAFPVDRDGNDIKAIKQSLKLLKENKALVIFPEGTRNDLPGKNHREGKAGTTLIAIRSKVRIVPVTIDSNFKFRDRVRIIYHEPISLEKYYGSRLTSDEYIQIMNEILDQIYEKMELRK